jgi:3-isopropylmalate/(R)-2-methylmalate dehydratase small subunit
MKQFGGPVLFLDRCDINTDEIIPAKYLTENTKRALKPHLLEDLHLKGFDPLHDIADKKVIVTRDNFGCGSSREHAAWALEENGIYMVIASSFARIFRQNMFNCGMLAVELASEDIDTLFSRCGSGKTTVEVELEQKKVVFRPDAGKSDLTFHFEISEFDMALVIAGGWLEYADKHY